MATFTIRPATFKDLPLIATLNIASQLTHPIVSIPWPTPAACNKVFLSRYTAFFNSPLYHNYVACAPDGEIIGFVNWKEPGEEEWKPEMLEGTDLKFISYFLEDSDEENEIKKGFKEGGLWEMDALSVHPSQHRKGVGSSLVKKFVDHLDEVGAGCWLRASPMGKPVYERFGWEVVAETSKVLEDWGRAPYVTWLMRRDAKKVNV